MQVTLESGIVLEIQHRQSEQDDGIYIYIVDSSYDLLKSQPEIILRPDGMKEIPPKFLYIQERA